MSQSVHLSEHLDPFLTVHPARDGWKVYELDECRLHLSYLLDCLRDWHPDALKYRFAVNQVEHDDLLGTPEKSHSIEPGTEWDLKKELNADRWTGLIEIVWQEHNIHYFSFEADADSEKTILVATTSNAALREFHSVLSEYASTRERSDEILVVNGRDIPIPQVCWNDVILPPGLAEDIRTNVEGFFQSRNRYHELGIPYRRGFLFTGLQDAAKHSY